MCDAKIEDFTQDELVTLDLGLGWLSRLSRTRTSKSEAKSWATLYSGCLDSHCGHAATLARLAWTQSQAHRLVGVMCTPDVECTVDISTGQFNRSVTLRPGAWWKLFTSVEWRELNTPTHAPQNPLRSLLPILAGLKPRRPSELHKLSDILIKNVVLTDSTPPHPVEAPAAEPSASAPAAPTPSTSRTARPRNATAQDHWGDDGRGRLLHQGLVLGTAESLQRLKSPLAQDVLALWPDAVVHGRKFDDVVRELHEYVEGTGRPGLGRSSVMMPFSPIPKRHEALCTTTTAEQLFKSIGLHHLMPEDGRHGSIQLPLGDSSDGLRRELAAGAGLQTLFIAMDPGTKHHDFSILVTKKLLDAGVVASRTDDPPPPFRRHGRISSDVGQQRGERVSGAILATTAYQSVSAEFMAHMGDQRGPVARAQAAASVASSSLSALGDQEYASARWIADGAATRAWQFAWHDMLRRMGVSLSVSPARRCLLFAGAADFSTRWNTQRGTRNVGDVALLRAVACLPDAAVISTNEHGSSCLCPCCGDPWQTPVSNVMLPKAPNTGFTLEATTLRTVRIPNPRAHKVRLTGTDLSKMHGTVFSHDRRHYVVRKVGEHLFAIPAPWKRTRRDVVDDVTKGEYPDLPEAPAHIPQDWYRLKSIHVAPLAQQPRNVREHRGDSPPTPNLVFCMDRIPCHALRRCNNDRCDTGGRLQARDRASADDLLLLGLHYLFAGTIGRGRGEFGEYKLSAGANTSAKEQKRSMGQQKKKKGPPSVKKDTGAPNKKKKEQPHDRKIRRAAKQAKRNLAAAEQAKRNLDEAQQRVSPTGPGPPGLGAQARKT